MLSTRVKIAVLLLAISALFALPLKPAEAANVNIAVSGTLGQTWFCSITYQNGVCPATISVGDTVQWNFNGDIYSTHSTRHCSNGCSGTPGGTPSWDSPLIQVGTYSYTFTSPGTYAYQCEVHPLNMQGQITVSGPAVGGVSQLPDVDGGAPLDARGGSDSSVGVMAVIAAGAAASAFAFGGAAWYVRRRRLP